LNPPLDVLIVRKIGHPWQPELAVGAISETRSIVYNEEVVSLVGVTKDYLLGEAARQREEIARRQQPWRTKACEPSRQNRYSHRRWCGYRRYDEGGSGEAKARIGREDRRRRTGCPSHDRIGIAKDGRCLCMSGLPEDFVSVGSCYYGFPQVTDPEVVTLLGD
jgi:putative phosphoribosyl transferase